MLDLARNAARNSSTLNAILKQLDVNVIGTKGGKCITDNYALKDAFAAWTRNADFFDGLSLNTLLKLILKTQVLGGDIVLLFDDGLVEDSGKILLYEPDEIGNSSDAAVAKHYGKNARQSLGRVYSGNGRFIGAIVSRSQRGASLFDPSMSYFLKCDPDASFYDSKWIMPRNVYRISQGRGVAPLASSLASILDLEALCQFELAASKKNSQTIGQVLVDAQQEETQPPSPFGEDVDFSQMTDEEVEEYAKAVQEEKTVSLDRVRMAGVEYQVMPEGSHMELFDTKHPNGQIAEFIDFLAGKASASFGLSRAFATMDVDESTFKAQQLMSWPAFIEAQKALEGICDWILWRWSRWATRKGLLRGVPDEEVRSISWEWPTLSEVDENASQDANLKKLTGMTGSYKDILGNNWKEQLEQIKAEIQYCKENGLPHPAFKLLSGGESAMVGTPTGQNNTEE